MAHVADRHETIVSSFEALRRDRRAEPEWLREARTRAFERFRDRGFPTTRLEDWKFTNIAPIASTPFVRATPGLLTWEEVLRLADAALYRAKGRRNAWVGWRRRKAVADLAAHVVSDPDAAEADNVIRTCSSELTSGETIELLLRHFKGDNAA